MHAKPLNYGKLANIEQEEKKAPGKFLDRLREALHRCTEIDPEREEGRVILKDRFLTQSAPDIPRKLLKQAYGTYQSLDNLLQLSQSIMVGNMRKRKKERQKKTKGQAEALTMSMKTVLKQPEKNAQRGPGEKGWACYYCGKEGISSGIAFRHLSRPRLHVRSAKDHTGRETAPRGVGLQGRTQENQD